MLLYYAMNFLKDRAGEMEIDAQEIPLERPLLNRETVWLVEFGYNEYVVRNDLNGLCSINNLLPWWRVGRVEKCNLKKYTTGSVQPSWFVWDCSEFSIEKSHVPGNHQWVTLPLPVAWRLQGLRRHLLPNGEQYQLVTLSLSVARYCDAENDSCPRREKY